MFHLKYSRILSVLILLVFLLAFVTPTHAATITATQSGPWDIAATWGGTIPTNLDDVIIPNGISVSVTSIVVTRDGTTTLDGTLDLDSAGFTNNSTFTNNGTININDFAGITNYSNFTNNGTVNVIWTFNNGGGGTFTNNAGGSLVINTGFFDNLTGVNLQQCHWRNDKY